MSASTIGFTQGRCLSAMRLGCAVAVWCSLCVAEITAATYECLTTPRGIPRKVIIKKKDAVAYESCDFSGRQTPLRFFRKYFIFEESNQGYRVGEATVKTSIVGWARKDDVLPWNTEQAIFFINKKEAGRRPVQIWRKEEDIGMVGKPCFEESLENEQTTEPFPILEKRGEAVRVAFLWNVPTPLSALQRPLYDDPDARQIEGISVERAPDGNKPITSGKGQMRHIVQEARRMDVVLVIDVTGSMQKYMDTVRARLADIVASVTKMKVAGIESKVYVGVVAYRDWEDEATTFLTKSLGLESDMEVVNRFLDGLRAGGGGYKNEPVCDALCEACRSMRWGEHSFRVMCLISDAPPHTPDDDDTKKLKKANLHVKSEFFGRPFSEGLKCVREVLHENRVQLYALGVGENGQVDPEVKETFPQFVETKERFLPLEDAKEFIKALEAELKESRAAHDAMLAIMQQASDPTVPLSSLPDSVFEKLRVGPGVTVEEIKEMRGELIQTGWFQPAVGINTAVCVYMRRRELEDWGVRLRDQIKDNAAFKENQIDVFKGIAGKHLGPIDVRGIGDIIKVFDDVAYTPEIMRLDNLGLEDQIKVRQLRNKLNNIEMLLLMEKLFSKYEEGWVPMEYLPGSLSEIRGETKPASSRASPK